MPTTINLRALDDKLVRTAKSRAAEEGKTLKAWVVELVERALRNGGDAKEVALASPMVADPTPETRGPEVGVKGVARAAEKKSGMPDGLKPSEQMRWMRDHK